MKVGIEAFPTYQKSSGGPETYSWLTRACSSAIVHKNNFFRLYQRDSSDHNRSLFVIAHNNYIPVLNEYKSLFAVRVSHGIASHKFGRRNYKRLCNNRILFDLKLL